MTPEQRICRLLDVPDSFLAQLIEAGVFDAMPEDVDDHVVEQIRISWTLTQELGVNFEGVEVILHLLTVIRQDREHFSHRER